MEPVPVPVDRDEYTDVADEDDMVESVRESMSLETLVLAGFSM